MWSNMDTGPIRLSTMSRTRPARYSSGMVPPGRTRYRDLVDLVAIVLAAPEEAEPQLTALRSEAQRRALPLPGPFAVPARGPSQSRYAPAAGRPLLPMARTA